MFLGAVRHSIRGLSKPSLFQVVRGVSKIGAGSYSLPGSSGVSYPGAAAHVLPLSSQARSFSGGRKKTTGSDGYDLGTEENKISRHFQEIKDFFTRFKVLPDEIDNIDNLTMLFCHSIECTYIDRDEKEDLLSQMSLYAALLNEGEINITDRVGNTALHYATLEQDKEIALKKAQVLIDNGAIDSIGKTSIFRDDMLSVIDIAASVGNVELMRFLGDSLKKAGRGIEANKLIIDSERLDGLSDEVKRFHEEYRKTLKPSDVVAAIAHGRLDGGKSRG